MNYREEVNSGQHSLFYVWAFQLLVYSMSKKLLQTIKMIAFDVGDTLYQTNHPLLLSSCWNAEQELLLKHGFKFTQKQYLRAAEKAWRASQKPKFKSDELAVSLLIQNFLGFPENKILAREMADSFYLIAEKYKLKKQSIVKNALQVIKKLHKQGIELGIISDTSTSWARHWLKRINLNNCFSIIVLSNEIGFKKASHIPFKEFLKQAKSKFGFKANEIAMIGDLSVDMDAKKFGMHTILFNPLKLSVTHFECKPDFVITDLKEIPKIICFTQ